jgi:hypothetical protein
LIRQSSLRQYSITLPLGEQSGGVDAAKRLGRKTAFLCHSHQDRDKALRVQSFLHEQGWRIYIDWQDAAMPSTPDRSTAENIQRKIRQLDWFLFLATEASMASRWCPWEIGYADGAKGKETIAVIPTRDDKGTGFGSEYMKLYRRIDEVGLGWRMLEPGGQTGVELRSLR